ncbi:hypothetical protein RRF57_001932 [Xylaria bambusicola]|uniref:Uncharacterized protein n=1 Tax=Xylaria bambusicola TaxID=326684 RepID=A0AAN7UEI8_9PEZI
MVTSIARFLRQQCVPPTDVRTSFSGKTIIVTGANTGLGFEAALKFVLQDASRVILGVRDLTKGEMARDIIDYRTGWKGRIDIWQLDMSSYPSIQEFAERAATLERLDIVVLNAGVLMSAYKESSYGWEETLQVNLLSTALLGLLLLPLLEKTSSEFATEDNRRPILEFITSGAHKHIVIPQAHRDADSLLKLYSGNPGKFEGHRQYGISKLFVMYVMQTLADFVKSVREKDPVRVLAVCPGACNSQLGRNFTGVKAKIVKKIADSTIMRTPEEGSRTLISATTLGDEAHGQFWQHDQIQQYVIRLRRAFQLHSPCFFYADTLS